MQFKLSAEASLLVEEGRGKRIEAKSHGYAPSS